ncbi:MAG: Holliday junction resolvase RuvX [Sulfuricurvum sp.]
MKIASIDLGLKRIGVAISLHSGIVTPLQAIIRKNRDQAARDLKALLDEWGIEALVVGLPLGGSSEDEMRRRVAHFLTLLDFDGEVFYQDEAFSSAEASELMRGEMKQVRDGRLDSISAMIILERFLAKS